MSGTVKKENAVSEVLKIFENDWNKQVILYGPPGTSKTYSATIIAATWLQGKRAGEINYEEAREYLKNNSNYKLVQFHPSYSYEDFVRGIAVKPADNGITYEVESKIIEKFCLENSEEKKVLIIDEINRAPLASVLGELIYGLEYREEEIATPYELKGEDGEIRPLKIPKNLYIIGTMNTADRTIGAIDYAVRRRFAFVKVSSRPDAIKESWADKKFGKKAEDLYTALMDEKEGIFAEDLREDSELDVGDIKIGHTYFLGKNGSKRAEGESDKEYEERIKESEKGYLKYRIDYQIRPIYEEYVKDGLISREGIKKFNMIVEHAKIDA